ncbi:MAG: winged helix-turn-helix domain-containing protein [Bryobacterales bacterium]|nr:winged helix-turn-helix domain-containing protein [Bryobacterales bacterium]
MEAAPNSVVPPAERLRFGDAVFDPAMRRLTIRDQEPKLGWRSKGCLALLLEARGAVVSKEEFQMRVWDGALIEDSNVSHAIAAIRKALDPAPGGDSYIATVARSGYRLAVPVVAETAPASGRRLPWLHLRLRWSLVATTVGCLVFMAITMYNDRQDRNSAEELVREGLLYSRRGVPAEGDRAVELFERALLLHPGYPPAQAALAETAARFAKAPVPIATELARDALKSDPRCAECMATLGYILMSREWAWEEAGSYLRAATLQNPNEIHHRLWYSQWLCLQGRLAEAQLQAEHAVVLDPRRPQSRSQLAGIHYFAGRNREAIEEARATVALSRKSFQAFLWMERAFMLDRFDADVLNARAASTAAWTGWTDAMEFEYTDRLRRIFVKSGRHGVANALIDDVNEGISLEVNRYNRALWNMWIDEHQRALDELEAGLRSKPFQMVYTAIETAFVPLHDEPRFQEVVRQIGLSHAVAEANRQRGAGRSVGGI